MFALELGQAVRPRSDPAGDGRARCPGTLATLVATGSMLLPRDTRAALLAASAMSNPTLDLVERASGGRATERLAPALAASRDRARRGSHPFLSSAARLRGVRRGQRSRAPRAPSPARGAPPRSRGARTPPCAWRRGSGRGRRGRSRAAGAASTSPRCLRGRGRAVRAGPAADARGDGGKPAPAHRRGRGLRLGGRRRGAGQGALRRGSRVSAQPGPRRGEVLYWLGSFQEYEGDRREAVELYREARSNAGDDVALRARAEEGLASALFLLRSDLSAAADHARAAVALAEASGGCGYGDRRSQPARPR